MSRPVASAVGTMLFVLYGPLIWALHFLVVYGGHASLCAVGVEAGIMGQPVQLVLVWTATLLALAAIAAGLFWPRQVQGVLHAVSLVEIDNRLLVRIMRLLALLSFLAVVFAGLASLIVPFCAQLR